MKNTMKKLLCMALVIMLLVSAVPAFAMADDGFGDDLSPVTTNEFGEVIGADQGSSDTEDTEVSSDSEVADSVPAEGEAGESLKVYAYLYTANQDMTQYKSVKSYSGKNVNGNLTVGDLLKKTEFLGQGVYDSNGISEFQKYTYYVAFSGEGKVAPEEVTDEYDGTATLEAGYYTFVRVRKQVEVTLEVDGDTVYGAKTIKANTYDVLNLPTVFKNNGLKANSGYYLYMYTRDADETPLGENWRVPGNAGDEGITIIGHQDLLSNKAENDSNGVGNAGTSGGTTGGSGSGSTSGSGSSSGTTKFPHIYLAIYKDTTVGSPDKRIEITKGIAQDDVVTLSEVKSVVKNYYSAKDDNGIQYDGLYVIGSNWADDYVNDNGKSDKIDTSSMSESTIAVMITNAKTKSTSTADASNPKTGDAIFVPVMVMGLTGTALAAAYVFGKKRIAR